MLVAGELSAELLNGAGGAGGVDAAHGGDDLMADVEGGIDVAEGQVGKPRLIEGAREGDVIVRSETTPALLHLAELMKVNV